MRVGGEISESFLLAEISTNIMVLAAAKSATMELYYHDSGNSSHKSRVPADLESLLEIAILIICATHIKGTTCTYSSLGIYPALTTPNETISSS